MGEQRFARKPLAEAAEQALVAAVGSGDAEDMRVSTPGACVPHSLGRRACDGDGTAALLRGGPQCHRSVRGLGLGLPAELRESQRVESG